MPVDLRLAIMSFPQRWDGTNLSINVLCVPGVGPLTEPIAGASPTFADHVPEFRGIAIPSLDALPTTSDPLATQSPVTLINPAAPVAPRPTFLALAAQATSLGVTIGPPPAPPVSSVLRIRKALPQSYMAITGTRPTGDLTTTTDDFGCEIRGQQPGPVKGPPARTTSWAELISYALRQPVLSTALGLRYELTFPVDRASFADGGWVFVELAAEDAWAAAAAALPKGIIRLYAGRVPPLGVGGRQLFGAVLFPVDATGTPDPLAIPEAETYDGGFAQIVHVHQPLANDAAVGDTSGLPAAVDVGVQIGWDDEQVVNWTNRQLTLLAARRGGTLDAQPPLGVLGYRVDVADITGRDPASLAPLPWESLMFVHSPLPGGFGTFDGELMIEPSPVRINDSITDAWLPHYFASWRGGCLVVADQVPNRLLKKPAAPSANTALPISTLLSYGRSYAFRVRLGDLSHGGPLASDSPVAPGPSDVATLTFKRMVPPKGLTVEPNLPAGAPPSSIEPESLTVHRPVIGYPEVLYTALGATAANRDALVAEYVTRAAAITPGSGDVAGVPDPDVDRVRITVEVRTPAHDIAGPGATLDGTYRVLYETVRAVPALAGGPIPTDPGLSIDVAYVDAASIDDWAPDGWPTVGPLVVPRARDVHLRFEPLVRDDPSYFGAGASRGLTTTIAVRAEARDEPALLVQDEQRDEPVRGYLFRRPPGLAAPAVATQLAQLLRLIDDGLTLTAPPGQRVAFGASRGLRQTISADGGTITFAAESELLRHWLVAIVVDLDRDWTWDGLGGPLVVERNGEIVGTLTVPRTLSPAAVVDPVSWQRARSRLVFFDTVDPHEPTASGFPEALRHTWIVKAESVSEIGPVVGVAGTPTFVAGHLPEPPQTELGSTPLSLTLPIAIPPKQVPKLVSVGTALSPYVVGDGYASTSPRQRALWLELAEPIANPDGDALFARVIGHGADPLLYDPTPSADQPFEPPLALDPELMRLITPRDSDDRAGLDAMTQLQKALDSDVHYLLRVPEWLDPDDPELFGFWTYELRVGHAGDPHAPHQQWWSTAQGRYGRPLRVTGVQHPAPGLVCHAGRITIGANSFIEATAPFASPVLNGQPLVSPFDQPTTTICFLLYAQVVQADGSTNRNVLLDHRYGIFEPRRIIAGDIVLETVQRDRIGRTAFPQQDVDDILVRLGLATQTPLSMLAVELLPGGVDGHLPKDKQPHAAANGQGRDPLGDALRHGGRPQRILRASPLVPIAPAC